MIYKVLKTNVKEVFIIKGKNGILYKNKNIWIVEYYNTKSEVVREKYKVIF